MGSKKQKLTFQIVHLHSLSLAPSPSYPTSQPRIVVIFAQLQNPNQYFENKIGWIIFFPKLSPLPLAAVTIQRTEFPHNFWFIPIYAQNAHDLFYDFRFIAVTVSPFKTQMLAPAYVSWSEIVKSWLMVTHEFFFFFYIIKKFIK